MKICKIEDCGGEVYATEMCTKHYQYNRKHGTPIYIPNKDKECEVEDCESKVYAKGYCQPHYEINRTTGSPVRPPKAIKKCASEDCDKDAAVKGLCKSHYMKMWFDTRVGKGAVDEKNPSTKTSVGYGAAHYRVRVAKGRASDHKCVGYNEHECDQKAQEWSLNEGSEDVLIQASGHEAGKKFSMNIDDYQPRCRSCHRRHDVENGVIRENAYKRGTAA